MPEYILFVDDEKLIKRLVAHYFRDKIFQREYEFIFAHNGKEAIEKLQENSLINLVITDINMPEMDGITLLGEIRKLNQNIKSIVISAYEDLKIVRQAMNQGALDFINKPIDFQDLENTISRTLDYIHSLKQESDSDKSNQVAVSEQLGTDIRYDIKHPSHWADHNIYEAQSVIKDVIQHLQVYQQNFTDLLPEILQETTQINRADLLADVSKIINSMKMGSERLEQISKHLSILSTNL